MAAAPLRTELADTYPAPSNAVFKGGIGAFWDSVTGLLGITGTKQAALTALRVLGPDGVHNLSLVPSVGSSALTMAVKTAAGATPSADDPVMVSQRNATAGTGDFNLRTITAALSLVFSSGSTLGHTSAVQGTIYWYLLDNAGAQELAASTTYFGKSGIVSTTAEGGAGGADNAAVMYSATLRTNVPFRCIGRTLDTQTTAGVWAAVPSEVLLLPVADIPVVPLPALGTDGYPLAPVSGSTGLAFLPPALGYNLVGGYLDWTVGSSILTVAVKTWAGNDPSATEPVFYPVRDATAATGSLTYRKLTAALSIAINNTALLGTVNSIAFRLWAVVFNDGGTDRLAVINCLTTLAGEGAGRDVTAIYPLAGFGIASATQEDNASDSAGVFYSNGAAVASKAYAVLGYATWETGLAAAGTWSAGPTRKQLFGPGVPLPGQTIQSLRNDTAAVATGTTVLPHDNTIPQSNEGVQFMTQAITPSSASNALKVSAQLSATNSATGQFVAALFQDATGNALAAVWKGGQSANDGLMFNLTKAILASGTAATTFKVRVGMNNAGTMTFNGAGGSAIYGSVLNSFLEVQEIMA